MQKSSVRHHDRTQILKRCVIELLKKMAIANFLKKKKVKSNMEYTTTIMFLGIRTLGSQLIKNLIKPKPTLLVPTKST